MAGYTEIQIDGQQVGLRFGVAALQIAAQKGAIKITGDTLETPGNIATARYLHSAYLDNCYVKEVMATIPFEKFVEWSEEQMLGDGMEFKRVSDVIVLSNYVKPKEDADKKKVQKKKSTGTK